MNFITYKASMGFLLQIESNEFYIISIKFKMYGRGLWWRIHKGER